MALSGPAMLLKSLGLDPEEIQQNVESFKAAMAAAVAKIDANQARIEAKLDEILAGQKGETTAIVEDGKHTGVLMTTEKFPDAMLRDVGLEAVSGVRING